MEVNGYCQLYSYQQLEGE